MTKDCQLQNSEESVVGVSLYEENRNAATIYSTFVLDYLTLVLLLVSMLLLVIPMKWFMKVVDVLDTVSSIDLRSC